MPLHQVLKPTTKQKLRIEGDSYQKVLAECFQSVPSYLGGNCTCIRCVKLQGGDLCRIPERRTITSESIINDGDSPLVERADEYDMIMENNCSQTIRSAVIGILIVFVLIAFIEGMYNTESRPVLLL